MTSATLYTLSAPSGAGKTSLVKALTEQLSNIQVSISHTTRSPRPGEVDGVNYHFVDTQTFQQMIAANAFLEHANVFGNYYGTSAAWVQQQLASGRDVLLEIDWQGAAQIKQLMPATVAVFILPPSLTALEQRLTGRGQDPADVIAKRLAEAKNEIAHAHAADYLIVNDKFDEALQTLCDLFTHRHTQSDAQKQQFEALLASLS